jgi:hypothetical protein
VQAKLEDEIKALRDTVDLQEYEHRMAESKYQKDLKKRIEEEVEDTTKQNEEIAQRWSIVTALEVPQELAKQIEAQHQACNAVLNSKDKVIQEICAQLKAKDVEYSLTVEQQAIDINNLMATMSRQVCSLLLCPSICLSIYFSVCLSCVCSVCVYT